MPRARNVKPGFFKNELLAECEPLARILFEGLWCEADREGRLEDRPRRLKAEYLPYDDCDVDALLAQLAVRGFIVRYIIDGRAFIAVPMFTKHQNPHVREPASTIPKPDSTVLAQCQHRASTEPARLIPESPSLIPDSGIQRKADASPAAPPLRGSRLKPTWTPALNTEEWVAHNFPAVDYAGQLDAFRDYWTAKPGKDGCKLDWDATFRNWIRNSRQTTRAGPTAKPKTVAAYDAIGAKIDELSTVVPGRDRARIAGPDPAKP